MEGGTDPPSLPLPTRSVSVKSRGLVELETWFLFDWVLFCVVGRTDLNGRSLWCHPTALLA